MNTEKFIKSKLNSAVDDIAPDILNNILATEIEPLETIENDLRDEALFLNEKKSNARRWIPAGACAFAVMFMAIIAVYFTAPNQQMSMACTITLDINPSIDVVINEEGVVTKLVANNKDAEKIVKSVNKKLDDNEDVESVMAKISKKLNKEGFLNKKKDSMLVSVEKGKGNGSEYLKAARKSINSYKKDNKKKFVIVYQEYEVDDEVKKVAKENSVSKAKAAYCLKVSKKTDKECKELCKETISDITQQVMFEEIDLGSEVEIVDEIETEEESSTEIESTSEQLETESVEETTEEITEELTEQIEETTADAVVPEETMYIEEEVTPEAIENGTQEPTT